MAICPKCKKEIEELINIQSGWNSYKMSVNGYNFYADYDEIEFNVDDNVNDFNCPKCDTTLFTSEDKAIGFLKDKDKLKEIVREKIEKIRKAKEK